MLDIDAEVEEIGITGSVRGLEGGLDERPGWRYGCKPSVWACCGCMRCATGRGPSAPPSSTLGEMVFSGYELLSSAMINKCAL